MSARLDAIRWLSQTIADMSGPYPDLVKWDFEMATDRMAAAIEEMRQAKAATSEPEARAALAKATAR